MEKVKVTREQAEAIERWENKTQLLKAAVIGLLEHGKDEPIAEMDTETLAKAIYIGYEVEPEYSVGDWVVPKEQNEGFKKEIKPYQILRIDDRKSWLDCDLWVYNLQLRHATLEEIAEEKERRWWAKHNRELWELRIGDVLLNRDNELCEVTGKSDLNVFINDKPQQGSTVGSYGFKVVCFAEDRKDIGDN